MTDNRLRVARELATIFASVAVPLLVAIFGWNIQSGISEEGVRKDYVQIAVGILSRPASPADKSIREWAITVLAKNSPVPFTSEARGDLAMGFVVIRPNLVRPLLDSPMMEPPQDWLAFENPKSYTLEKLIDNYGDNMRRARSNFITLKYLQEAVRKTAEAEASYGIDPPAKPESKGK